MRLRSYEKFQMVFEPMSGSTPNLNPSVGMSKVFMLDKYFSELQKFWDTEKRLQGGTVSLFYYLNFFYLDFAIKAPSSFCHILDLMYLTTGFQSVILYPLCFFNLVCMCRSSYIHTYVLIGT